MKKTPHINAEKEDIAKIVLMPGDPLRAKVIANKYLENVKEVNNIRNMLMFTGKYKDKKVTIAGSGMGCASIGIYSYELFKFYDVDVIIRIGSAGSYIDDLKIYDLFNTTKAYSESTFAKVAFNYEEDILLASPDIVEEIKKTAEQLKLPIRNGIVHSSDVFYRKNANAYQSINEVKKAEAVEMESFALFANAKFLNKKAACILTISDSLVNKLEISAEAREKSFENMMKLALETAFNLQKI